MSKPIDPGVEIGMFENLSSYNCVRVAPGAGYSLAGANGDIALNTPAVYGDNTNFELDVSAELEPDVDQDGFGDETQDACPTNGSRQTECVPPETTITKSPGKKTKKKKATLRVHVQ